MWSATRVTILSRLKKHHQTLQHRPAAQMFPLGLALGGSIGAMALLGLGQLPGLVVCVLLLVASLPLLRGAEPVIRQRPVAPVRTRREVLLPEVASTPSPLPVTGPDVVADVTQLGRWALGTHALAATEPRVVEDISGLLDMVELPGGTFWMGSAEDDAQAYSDEKPQHEVTVPGFAIGRVLVTRRLYREVMTEYPQQWAGDQDDDLLPANAVSWFDAVTFCNRLSERQGLTPCYRIEGDQVSWQRDAHGYRLPTEAEWEYAARAGTTTRWFCGDEPTTLGEYAWYDENAGDRVHPVGQKAPNPWGLSDMAGNVYEWCWDRYAAYAADAVNDPIGANSGGSRVLRGGASWDVVWYLRSAFRLRSEPTDRLGDFGVRVVRRPGRQP